MVDHMLLAPEPRTAGITCLVVVALAVAVVARVII